MADHMQDEADLEALKRWWDENGKGIVAAVVVAVLGTVGWQQYQGFTVSQAEAASDLYATMLAIQLEEDGDADQFSALAAQLKDEHSGSTYARFGAMLEARRAVDSGDLDGAESALRWALTAGDTRSDVGQLSSFGSRACSQIRVKKPRRWPFWLKVVSPSRSLTRRLRGTFTWPRVGPKRRSLPIGRAAISPRNWDSTVWC